MVCQAASKTRFRALKHEYGIAGSATIVVRIIACFQPLQDCQAEYFRHLLKPVTIALRSMGGSFDPKFHRWMQNTGMNYGSNLVMPPYVGQPKLNPMEPPAYVNPFDCAFPRNEASGFNGFAAPHLGTYLMNLESSGVTDQKRFLVFDQSGYQTSLIYSSVAGPSCQNVDPLNVKAPELASFGARFEANRAPIVLSNETNVSSDDKGSQEMHEDTEEINALLYSESDYIHEQEEDEVSTGHSPLDMTETSVQFADSSTHAKKRRLNRELDGALADSASSARHLHLNYNDAQSSCIRGSGEEGSKRLKRKRIQETVGVLRRIIPGGKGKDAAAVLDEAIQYLKSLKLRAKEGFGTSF